MDSSRYLTREERYKINAENVLDAKDVYGANHLAFNMKPKVGYHTPTLVLYCDNDEGNPDAKKQLLAVQDDLNPKIQGALNSQLAGISTLRDFPLPDFKEGAEELPSRRVLCAWDAVTSLSLLNHLRANDKLSDFVESKSSPEQFAALKKCEEVWVGSVQKELADNKEKVDLARRFGRPNEELEKRVAFYSELLKPYEKGIHAADIMQAKLESAQKASLEPDVRSTGLAKG